MPLAALAASLLLVLPALSQQRSHCDPVLPQNTDTDSGYQDRGDRCEGVYRSRKVSPTSLLLVAFDARRQELTPGTTVVLQWGRVNAGDDALLTVQNLRRGSLYRMDHGCARGERAFRWDTRLAARAGVQAGELGAVVTSHVRIEGTPQQVYLPVTTATEAAPSAERRLRFRLGSAFKKLSWRYYTYDAALQSAEMTADWKPFAGRLDKDTLVSIDVALPRGRCFYFELAGKEESGLPSEEALYLCEPAN